MPDNNNAALASMVARDQAERNAYKQFVQTKANGDYDKGAELYAKLKKRSRDDIFGELATQHKFMKMQFDFGKFTETNWQNYWLMAQHCDSNRNFQKTALAAIAKYQGKDNDNYRYLYDRISCGTTGKQKYGTQQECSIDSVDETITFSKNKQSLNVKELIAKGAIFITDPHDVDGWELDTPDWSFSLITLANVLRKSPPWTTEYKHHLKPKSYNTAINDKEFWNSLSDQKYNQILWSIKKLGIPDSVAFLDDIQPVTETFDKPYKSKWETSDYGDVDVLAKLPDGTNLSIMFNNEGDNDWQVSFYRNNSQEVTGEGDALRIFATVITAIHKFVKKHKPQLVRFSASKEVEPGQSSQSRAKLYDRIVERYARAWGYDVYQEDHGDQVTYELTQSQTDLAENTADGLISGKEMLNIFKRMHHEHGFNKQMERWIAKQTWSLDTIEPEQLQDMYNDDEDTDPFDRTVWLDDAAVTKYERILSAGHLVNPIIMGPGRAVIDGNHRAQAAKNLHVSIPGYVPVKNDVTENFAADVMSTDDMIAYISAHDGRTLHQDYLDDLNTFSQFVLKNISLDTLWTELPMLDRAKVEKYKQMDFSKAPPIVVGDGYILDGYHRATVAKALGIKSIKAYVGVKGVTENFADGKHPEDKGDSRRHGIPKHATLAQLDKISHQGGRKGQLAHWQANMRRGRAKTNEASHQYTKIHPAVVADIIAAVPEAQEIWFHGSRARGTHKSRSDWDFLVIVPKYNDTSDYIDVIDRLHNIASEYKNYDIQPSYATNIIARIAKEEGRLLWSADTAITEAIAPHGDSWNELNLMKIGEKPAALVGPYEFENLYKPVMQKYKWIWTQVNIPNPDPETLVLGFDRYIIGQPGEQARIARMHHLLVQMNKNLKNDIRPDADYHIEMGRLLGYSDTDIAEFLKKINL